MVRPTFKPRNFPCENLVLDLRICGKALSVSLMNVDL